MFGTFQQVLGKFDDYEGCTNLVYRYENVGQSRILRLSYHPDRTAELIQAIDERKDFIARYMEHVMTGYTR